MKKKSLTAQISHDMLSVAGYKRFASRRGMKPVWHEKQSDGTYKRIGNKEEALKHLKSRNT